MTSVVMGPMCVVCGRSDRAGGFRKSGFKCFQCKGEASDQRLRDLSAARGAQPATVVTSRSTSPYAQHRVYSTPSPSRHHHVYADDPYTTARVLRRSRSRSRSPTYVVREPSPVVVREAHYSHPRHRSAYAEAYDGGPPIVVREGSGSVLRERPVVVAEAPAVVHASRGGSYVLEDSVSPTRVVSVRDPHLEAENRRLRQREAWLAEARAAHRDGVPCEWCDKYHLGRHSHPCPFSPAGTASPVVASTRHPVYY